MSYLGRVLLAPSERRPGIPLNVLQSSGQPLTAQTAFSAEAEKPWRSIHGKNFVPHLAL